MFSVKHKKKQIIKKNEIKTGEKPMWIPFQAAKTQTRIAMASKGCVGSAVSPPSEHVGFNRGRLRWPNQSGSPSHGNRPYRTWVPWEHVKVFRVVGRIARFWASVWVCLAEWVLQAPAAKRTRPSQVGTSMTFTVPQCRKLRTCVFTEEPNSDGADILQPAELKSRIEHVQYTWQMF